MINYQRISKDLNSLLRGFGLKPITFDFGGNETVEEKNMRYFYNEDPNLMCVLDEKNEQILLYKGQTVDLDTIKTLLAQLRKLADFNILKFNLKLFGKTIKTKDFSKFPLQEGILNEGFSKLVGSSKTSIQVLENVKIIIKHNKPVNENIKGSRTRNINSIFIESNGNTFMYPYPHLRGARAMARHISEGGEYTDDFSTYIVENSKKFIRLKEFVSYVNKNNLLNESTTESVNIVKNAIKEIQESMSRASGKLGYKIVKESFRIFTEEHNCEELNEIKDMFTVKYFEESLSDVLPIVNELKKNNQKYKEDLWESIEEGFVVLNPTNTTVVHLDPHDKFISYLSHLGENVTNTIISKFLKEAIKNYKKNKKLNEFEILTMHKLLEKINK